MSDRAMEEARHDMSVFREFVGLEAWDEQLPDKCAILRFRHMLEKHILFSHLLQAICDLLSAKGVTLKSSTVVDTTLIAAQSSTKNGSGEFGPQMKQGLQGREWYLGMKCSISVDIGAVLTPTEN